MVDISKLTEIPEEEESLYLEDKKTMSSIKSSDDAYAARFRYETQQEGKPKSNYFGKVDIKGETSYVSPFFKSVARSVVGFIPTATRELSRMGTDLTAGAVKHYHEARLDGLNFQIQQLEQERGVTKMTPEQKKDFYQNDPDYTNLYNKVMKRYDDIIELENPQFDKQINEVYAETKKNNEAWIEQWGLDKDEKDSEVMYEIGQGATSLLSAVALTALTKNPMAAATAFGIGQTGSVYEELREKGVDPKTAIAYSAPAGIAEGALESVGLHQFIENLGARTVGRMVLKNIAVEAIQEGSQQTAEEVILSRFRPEAFKEKAKRVAKSMAYGGILGGFGSIASRPFFAKQVENLKEDLAGRGVDPSAASELVETAAYGGKKESDEASQKIQKIIGVDQWKKEGLSEEEATIMAEKMIQSTDEIKTEILQTANAELDPETYEGGSIEESVKFFDKELQRDFVSEDFDIKEKVKQTALNNGVKEEDAELAGTLSESFARVVSNITNESPREQWENGGELIVEDQRPRTEVENMFELTDDDIVQLEDKREVWDDGSYVGEDGKIHRADGTVLFQSGREADTNTPEFKNWFGESKVVDKQGNPITVYHGSPSGGFNIFNLSHGGRSNSGIARVGFWFSDAKELAEDFSQSWGGNTPQVYPVYLKMENPKIYEYQDNSEKVKQLSAEIEKLKQKRKDILSESNEADFIRWRYAEKLDFESVKEILTAYQHAMDPEAEARRYVDFVKLEYEIEEKMFERNTAEAYDAYDQLLNDFDEYCKFTLWQAPNFKRGSHLTDSAIDNLEEALKNFKDKLISEGYDGIWVKNTVYDAHRAKNARADQFVVFESTQIKSIYNKGSFDPKNSNIYLQGEKNAPRGYIQMKEMQYIINLLKTADPSTIVHELGHYFVDRYIKVLEQAGKTEELNGVLEWLGVKDYRFMGREEYEKFARGFETYVMEGVSPNAKMSNIFSRFKQWLLQIYKDLKGGNVIPPEQINDNVRDFFDKMLATDEDINIDIEGIKGKVAALRDVINNALAGKEVSIDGVGIEEVNELLKAVSQRIPRKPKNLTQLLREVGINLDFAKLLDIREAMGLQDSKGGASGLFRKHGGIDKEDSLVEFLKANGFIYGESDTYQAVSDIWDDAITAIENSDNLYRPDDQAIVDARDSIMEAVNIASEALDNLDYDKVLKAIKDLRSKNIVAVQKDTMKYIRGKLKSIDADYKKIIKNLLKSQKEDFEARRNDLIDFIKGQPLTGDSKVKLLGQIKKANSLSTFQKVAKIIKEKSLEYYGREQRRIVDEKIQSELKQTRPTEMQKQKYDYMTNKLFLDLREYNKMNQKDAEELASKMFAGHTSDELQTSDEADKIRRRFLVYKAKGAEASADLLSAVYQDIVRMKELGRLAKDDAHYIEMLEREDDRQEIISILDASSADSENNKTKLLNIYRRGFTNLYSLLNSVFGKKIADKYEFEVKQTEVDSKIYLKTQGVIEKGCQLFEVKNKSKLLDLFAEMSDKKSPLVDIKEGLDQQVDRFQIMDIYNAIKNEKTRDDYYRNFGEEQVNNLVNSLSVKEKAFADYLQDEINSYYDAMNKVYIQLYDIDLPKVENYWPATSEHKDVIDIQGDYYNQSTTPSAFKERAPGAKIPIPKNAWEKFGKHIAEAEYITGLGVDYMNVKRIFKSRRIESKIKKHFGDGVYRNLMDDIESMSINHKIKTIDDVADFFQKGLNNWVVAKIAFNPSVFFNQLTSMTNYTENMPIAIWTKYFAEGLANPKKTASFMMKQAPFLKARFGAGNNESLARAISEAGRFGKKKGKWTTALTSWTRTGDVGAIVYGGYPYLRWLQEQGDADALKKFEFATLRSQQAGTEVSLSPFQRNKNSVMRFFLAFKNTPQQYMRKIIDANIMLYNKDIDAKQYAKTMFNYGVLQPIFYIMMSNFIRSLLYFNDDDEDRGVFDGVFKQILLNPVDAIPVFSDMLGYSYDRMSGNPAYKVIRYPMLDDLESSFRKMSKKDIDAFDIAEIIAPLVEVSTGVPVKKPLNILNKNFYKE